jgi:hypothetical protein
MLIVPAGRDVTPAAPPAPADDGAPTDDVTAGAAAPGDVVARTAGADAPPDASSAVPGVAATAALLGSGAPPPCALLHAVVTSTATPARAAIQRRGAPWGR